jgi:hypothetical protein
MAGRLLTLQSFGTKGRVAYRNIRVRSLDG